MSTARNLLPSMNDPEPIRHLADRLLHAVPATRELALLGDGVHSVHVHHAMEFRVLEGQVLVTVEGDPEDHVVDAGEAFRTTLHGHHVIAGLRPARVRISAV